MRKIFAGSVAVIALAAGLAFINLINQQHQNLEKSISESLSCQNVFKYIAPLQYTKNSDGARSWLYTQSLSNSVDRYTTFWNLQTESYFGQENETAIAFATKSMDSLMRGSSNNDQILSWDTELQLSLRLLAQASHGTIPSQALIDASSIVESHQKRNKLDQQAIQSLILTELEFRAPISEALKNNLDMKSLYYRQSDSLIENLERKIILTGLNVDANEYGFKRDFLSNTLEQAFAHNQNGMTLLVAYKYLKFFPDFLIPNRNELRTLIKSLGADGGGYAIAHGGNFEPQTTYYATVLSNNKGKLFQTRNFKRLKISNVWIQNMGRMPIGTQILSAAVLNYCKSGNILFTGLNRVSSDPSASLYSCYRTFVGDNSKEDFEKYIDSTTLGKGHSIAFERLCRISFRSNNKIDKRTLNADFESILVSLAQSLIEGKSIFDGKSSNGKSYKYALGCRFINDVRAMQADLISTSICLANSVVSPGIARQNLTKWLTPEGIATYEGQPVQSRSSVEAILWYFTFEWPESSKYAWLLAIQ